MKDKSFFQQLGIGVASLSFGVALSIFIYAAASGLVSGVQSLLLYITSFLLMLRFWWKYTELFIKFIPSHTFLQFLFDFLVSFFGILAVLFIGNIQTWAAIGIGAMAASAIRCKLSFEESDKHEINTLKRTMLNAVVMCIVMAAVCFLAAYLDQLLLAGSILILVLIFLFLVRK